MSLSPCLLPSRQKDTRKRISFLWDKYASGYPKAGEWSRSCSWRSQHLKSEGDETVGMGAFRGHFSQRERRNGTCERLTTPGVAKEALLTSTSPDILSLLVCCCDKTLQLKAS